MDKLVKELGKKPLSNSDIGIITNNKAKIMIYPQLGKYNNIDNVFGKYKCIILLYLTRANFGHWVCLINHGDKIEFFDPYGLFPDEELKFGKGMARKIKGQEFPHLTYLLSKASDDGYKLEYNNHKLQKLMKDVSTCGRHCAMRCVFRFLPLEEYVNLLKSDKSHNPDWIVTALTAFI